MTRGLKACEGYCARADTGRWRTIDALVDSVSILTEAEPAPPIILALEDSPFEVDAMEGLPFEDLCW